jgi:hypothetical protein
MLSAVDPDSVEAFRAVLIEPKPRFDWGAPAPQLTWRFHCGCAQNSGW